MDGHPSHKLVRTAISARSDYRGGIAADGKTGDGCGLPSLIHSRLIAEENSFKLGKQYACMVFFTRSNKAQSAKDIINKELTQETLSIAGWRDVPTNLMYLDQ